MCIMTSVRLFAFLSFVSFMITNQIHPSLNEIQVAIVIPINDQCSVGGRDCWSACPGLQEI